ncbi:putative O-methyltransferase [Thaumarchaeota archaeon SCGC AB-539-E09]|nr:putative O-methyltransferase [Thaumarchaeota archaeon SCGC AB-539-E09]
MLSNKLVMESDQAEKVLRKIEGSRRRGYLPIVGRKRGEELAHIIRKVKPQRILEVGTFVGYSTIMMGKELGEGSEIVTIEIDPDEAEMAKENIIMAELKVNVRVLTGDAIELIPTVEGEIDMVFLDADKSEYLEYLKLVEPRLHKESVVVADNAGSFTRSMEGYLEYVRDSGRYESEYIDCGWDGLEVSVKK